MKAIVIATVNAKCLPVLAASVTFYVPQDIPVLLAGSNMIFPRHQTITFDNVQTNFGDAYNAVIHEAFDRGYDEIVVCNDDIVFTPYTWQTLSEDVSALKERINPLGWVACRSDYARGYQNIRIGQGPMHFFKFETEHKILKADIIAPICAYVSKESWVDFPPLNWYSDDVQCLDMKAQHFISRAYVHHVGSETCGQNDKKCIEDAKPWLKNNRPELFEKWFKT